MVIRNRRRFLLADTGICVQPTLDAEERHPPERGRGRPGLGEPLPRVALMAATEIGHGVDARDRRGRRTAAPQQAGEFTGCVVQGPLSFDLAYEADAGDQETHRAARSSGRPT